MPRPPLRSVVQGVKVIKRTGELGTLVNNVPLGILKDKVLRVNDSTVFVSFLESLCGYCGGLFEERNSPVRILG
jgi:hypothetical protein